MAERQRFDFADLPESAKLRRRFNRGKPITVPSRGFEWLVEFPIRDKQIKWLSISPKNRTNLEPLNIGLNPPMTHIVALAVGPRGVYNPDNPIPLHPIHTPRIPTPGVSYVDTSGNP